MIVKFEKVGRLSHIKIRMLVLDLRFQHNFNTSNGGSVLGGVGSTMHIILSCKRFTRKQQTNDVVKCVLVSGSVVRLDEGGPDSTARPRPSRV